MPIVNLVDHFLPVSVVARKFFFEYLSGSVTKSQIKTFKSTRAAIGCILLQLAYHWAGSFHPTIFLTFPVGRQTEFKTKVIDHDVNPTWDEWFECPVTDIHTSKVQVSLFDYDGPLAKSESLGT